MFRRYLIPILNSVARTAQPQYPIKNGTALKFVSKDSMVCRSLATTSVPDYSTEKLEKISYEDVKSLANNKKVVIIDVREPNELTELGILPGSINIPCEVEQTLRNMSSDEFLRKFGCVKPDNQTPLVFSCMKGMRSEKAQIIAIKLGYKKVANYLGGWIDWSERNKN